MPTKDFLADAKPVQNDYLADAQPVDNTPAPSLPRVTMQAAPSGMVQTLQDAENDLRHGGSRTMLGRGLGYLQGRGDKGYSGLESGTTPEVANIIGSVPLGLTRAMKGESESYTGHPVNGMIDTGAGLAQASTLPSAFMGGPIAEAADAAIPSRFRAGQMLEDIRNQAVDVPVNPSNTLPQLERFQQLTQRGGRTAKPMTQLVKRLTADVPPEEAQPFNFPEARDFYTNVSDLTKQSPLQTLMGRGLKPTMLRQAGNVRSGLNSDLTDAAGTIGRGEDYSNAIKEYANASKLRKAMIGGALVGGEEIARRTGLMGKAAKAVIPY